MICALNMATSQKNTNQVEKILATLREHPILNGNVLTSGTPIYLKGSAKIWSHYDHYAEAHLWKPIKFKTWSSAARNIILNCGHMLPKLRSIMRSYYHLQPIIQKPHLWTNGKITNDTKEMKFTKGNDHNENIYENMPQGSWSAISLLFSVGLLLYHDKNTSSNPHF